MGDVPLLIAIVANETREVALAWIRENMTEDALPDGDLYTQCPICEGKTYFAPDPDAPFDTTGCQCRTGYVKVERGNP